MNQQSYPGESGNDIIDQSFQSKKPGRRQLPSASRNWPLPDLLKFPRPDPGDIAANATEAK